ncbi:hypothetical protein [Actinomadura rugatobispora]|uniref:Uncharacterized protein n=1 Tax=Actinomadura rugatobispora TaxID=1994 RepID=A0ABW1AFH3_9ACTN|nr:hypothetical protein GCM10010200_020100 [Actinomadura rugatobispora]
MADMSWLVGEYSERKAAAEAHVTEWVPYSDAAFETEPLYGLRNRFRAGMPVDDAAEAHYMYGLDGEGRAWAERQAVEFEGQFYESFRVLDDGGRVLELALYDYTPQKNPIRHQTFSYENGVLAETAYQAKGGYGRTRYVHEDGRLVRIEDEHGESPERLRPFARVLVHYDEHGEIARLTQDAMTIYRAWPPDLTPDDAERAFLDLFAEALPAAVAAASPPVRPACLWLQYMPGQFSVLPPLALFPEEDGDAGIAEMLTDLTAHEIDLDEDRHPRLHELAGLLDQTPLDDDRVGALMSRAARRLNALDWTRHLPVPGDFFVFAADIEQMCLEDALREAAGAERARRLLALIER